MMWYKMAPDMRAKVHDGVVFGEHTHAVMSRQRMVDMQYRPMIRRCSLFTQDASSGPFKMCKDFWTASG